MYTKGQISLVEENRCPDCEDSFIRCAVGTDKGILCNHCGFLTKIAEYREIMKAFVLRKFISEKVKEKIRYAR